MSGKINEEVLEKVKEIPLGACISIFGSNKLTKLWGNVETHLPPDEIPTHSAIYFGQKGKHWVLEASTKTRFVHLEKYLKKDNKVVAQWYTNLTANESYSLYRRILWFKGKNIFYDVCGYLNFVLRLLPFARKIIKPSNKSFYCSELVSTIYEGDKKSAYPIIKNKWNLIKPISLKTHPSQVAPVDIYLFFKKLEFLGKVKTLIIKN